ncbi:hypothetical protein AB2M62_12580 [Sphingomonas sp. MMS12-HWE2-04]|uniref:hypothetical protein n=1 Tax=Sphingomonas sp. MMS12-HWE2-04 TaxID=3234199 RepID=UPI00384E6E00
MSWFAQVVLQSLLVAGVSAAFLWLSWLPAKAFLAVFLLYFLFAIGRNPIAFWRRLARFVLVAAIPSALSGITFRLYGQGHLPAGLADYGFAIEQASGDALPLVIAVLLCALAFDALAYWLQLRGKKNSVYHATPDSAGLSVERDGSIHIVCPLLIGAQDAKITITRAQLALSGLFPGTFECELYAKWLDSEGVHRPISPQHPLDLAASATESLFVTATIKRGARADWLRLLTSGTLGWTQAAQGELHLTAFPMSARTPLPVRFVRKSLPKAAD